MSETVKLLNCPSCGASLNLPAGEKVMQCPYCHSTVEISQNGGQVNSAYTPAAAESFAGGSSFSMTVVDVFSIKGRGTVATGRIESGTLRVGDQVRIMRANGSSKMTTVSGVEMFRKMLPKAKVGDNVGVLLKEVAKNDIQPGDILEAA
jgi:LSD1 subclass zinc finger protein